MVQRLAYSLKNPSYFADPFVTKDAQGNITAVNVTALDDYTVQYTLAEPNIAALAALTTPAGVPYDADTAKQQGALNTADAAKSDMAQAWFDQHSAGVGPYMLTSWAKEDSVVLERFADWAPLGAPYDTVGGFDKIIFKQVSGSGQQLQQLEADAIQVAMELDADAVKTASGDGNLSVASGQSLNMVFLALNVDPTIGGPLADANVRQAVAWSLDYDGYVNGLLGGGGVRPASPVPLGFVGTDQVQDKAYTQDAAKAQQLLQAANQPNPELSLTYGSGGSNDVVANETIAAKLQADLQAVGFKVTLVPEAADQRLADFRAAKLQLTFSEWIPGWLDVSDYATAFGGVQGAAPSNRVNYVSDANTQLLAAGIKESDPAKREQDYVQVMENLIDEVPFIPLWQANFQYGVGKGITNVVTHPSWLLMTHLIAPG
jgi:peptide/nickel transport system substrate-binding protein